MTATHEYTAEQLDRLADAVLQICSTPSCDGKGDRLVRQSCLEHQGEHVLYSRIKCAACADYIAARAEVEVEDL